MSDDLDEVLRRAVDRGGDVLELMRSSGMVQYDLALVEESGGARIHARAYPLRRRQMASLGVCEVPGFIPFKREGLVLEGGIASWPALEEYLLRLFRYCDRLERTRKLQSLAVTVAIRGLACLSGIYRFEDGERWVQVEDVYHTRHGHMLMTAARTGCLAELFRSPRVVAFPSRSRRG